MATALSLNFIRNGGYVCSCVFNDGKFGFVITADEKDLANFQDQNILRAMLSAFTQRFSHYYREEKKFYLLDYRVR